MKVSYKKEKNSRWGSTKLEIARGELKKVAKRQQIKENISLKWITSAQKDQKDQ